MKTSILPYRAEIDGLRAIAVVSVILYHARIVLFDIDWFAGGFIGVDIFFVISGYLITRIILSELHTEGRFSLINFYERRARRILPVLFVVIFVSIPFAWKRLLPTDFVEYAKSVVASLFFGSNFFFYFSTTEYGADSSLLKPFLHTWSLGVEEQFYLVFPLVSILINKYFPRQFLIILVGLSSLSFLFATLMVEKNSDLNFYYPFSRFWEIAIGSIIAYIELNYEARYKRLWYQFLPTVGLFLVVLSILFFNSKIPHPSFSTLVPVLGVILIILFSSRDEIVGKIIGSKPFVFIGLISYSAYLWHFPIFAFGRLDGEFGNIEKLILFLLVLTLSIISYHFLEKPFRNSLIISSKLFVIILPIFFIIILIWFGFSINSNGFESRFSEKQLETIKYFSQREYSALKDPNSNRGLLFREQEFSDSCYGRSPLDPCLFGRGKIVFLGDSFVGHYERAIVDRTENYGAISLTYGQCPFVSEEIWFGDKPECPIVNQLRKEKISSFRDEKIFIVSANYDQFKKPKVRTNNPLEDGRNGLRVSAGADEALAWSSYFDNINWLLDLGHKVVVIGILPSPTLNAQGWIMDNRHLIDKKGYPTVYNETLASDLRKRNTQVFSDIKNENLLFIDPSRLFCDEMVDRCLDVQRGVGPLYNGGGHLSYFGASIVADRIQSFLSNNR